MSLATYGGSLLLRLGALALDCICCIVCNGAACQFNSDCYEGCSCVQGQCRENCTEDSDCPAGYICVNGVCVPACNGEECASDTDCFTGCGCEDGQCWPRSDLYYCVWHEVPETAVDPDCGAPCGMRAMTDQEIADCENDPACEPTLPTRVCQRGRPSNELLVRDGPFLTYAECCGTSCDCSYECNADASCSPSPQGAFESADACNAACGLPDDVGACCEIRTVRDATGQIFRYERGPWTNPDGSAAPCPTTRSACVEDQAAEKHRSFRPLITDCSLCDTTQTGACCVDNGCIELSQTLPGTPIDYYECEEVLGGSFRSSWINCTTHRDPDVLATFACPDCNGQHDCQCDLMEYCVNRRCVPCLDVQFEIFPIGGDGWVNLFQTVQAGDTVRVLAKYCPSSGWGQGIESKVGNGVAHIGSGSLEYVADAQGDLFVRLRSAGVLVYGQVCIEIVSQLP